MDRLSTLIARPHRLRQSAPPPETGERRRIRRDRLATPVGLQIEAPGGGRIAGITTDLSDYGFGLYAWSALERGTHVTAHLGSFFSDAQMSGVVRDCIPDDFKAFRLSIEFEEAA